MASPEQGESAAGSPHSMSVLEKMDFDLFGPSSGSPSAQPPTTAAQVPGSGSAPVQLPVPPTEEHVCSIRMVMVSGCGRGCPSSQKNSCLTLHRECVVVTAEECVTMMHDDCLNHKLLRH